MKKPAGLPRRVLSLAIMLTILFSIVPAGAEGMSVALEVSDSADSLPAGSTVTVSVRGSGTAVVSLMVVPPDSRQYILEGPEHKITLSQPGMYILRGYGANGPDETAAGFKRCVSSFHMINVSGEASGTVTVDVFKDFDYHPVQGMQVRNPELYFRVTLNGDDIPEESTLSLTLHKADDSVELISGPIGSDKQWISLATQAAEQLLSGEDYGQIPMRISACVTTPDGRLISGGGSFSRGHYSPQMQYVNEFFDDNWIYGRTSRSQQLTKWLDMTHRDDDRYASGYLMLEQEMEFREENKPKEDFIKWSQKGLSTISTLGLSVAIEWIGNETTYKRMFGTAGKKALPYYNMLGSVYNDYAEALLSDIQEIARGAYLVEQIQQNTHIVSLKADEASSKTASDFLDVNDKAVDSYAGKQIDQIEQIYGFSSQTPEASYYRMGLMNDYSGADEFFTITRVEDVPLPDKSGTMLVLHWLEADGTEDFGNVTKFVNKAREGKRLLFDTSAVINAGYSAYDFNDDMYGAMVDTFGNEMRPFINEQGELVTLIKQETIRSVDTNFGKRRFIVGGEEMEFNAQSIEKLGLADNLSDTDKNALRKLAGRLSKAKYEILKASMTAANLANIGYEIYALHEKTEYHSALQEAYFNTYREISGEYIQMLYKWYTSLESSGSEEAPYIQAALKALMQDIYDSCDESLSNAARNAIVFTQTVEEWGNVIYDSVEFICSIPAVAEALKNATRLLATQAASAIRGSIAWVSTIVSGGSKAAASAAASVAAAASGTSTAASAAANASKASKVTPVLLVFSAGSFVLDLVTVQHLGYMESLYRITDLKKSLITSIEKELQAYGRNPTHQGAVNIIESLYLMKALKVKGENLVSAYYLSDMYKDFDIDGIKEQMVLMNEVLTMDDKQLRGSSRFNHVYVVRENYIAGNARDLKKQDYKLEGLGLFDNEAQTAVLGSRVIGMYRRIGSSPFTFQGVEIKWLPDTFDISISTREEAGCFDIKKRVWLKDTEIYWDHWLTTMPTTQSATMFITDGYVYSHNGLDLLLSTDEYMNYVHGERRVNDILDRYDDTVVDSMWIWQTREEREWQNQQRLVWTCVTNRYIESMPMFDRTEE